MIKFTESFRLHADMAAFLKEEIYAQDGIPFFSRNRALLAPNADGDDPDGFVARVLAPEHAMVVIVHDEARSQLRNPFEQQLITPILEALAASPYGLGPLDGLGVVVPHRAQRAALREAIPCLSTRDPRTGAITTSSVDTVERFQGGERTAILVSATESDRAYLLTSSEFLLDPRRLTVALSRAKYNQPPLLALEPITDRMFCGHWLKRSKHCWAAESSACFVSKNSQWVTSRRKCRHSISMGLSHGLYVGK
jgi:hypothetical protein